MKNIETINDYILKLEEEASKTNIEREKATYIKEALITINEMDFLSSNEKEILIKIVMNNETLINYKDRLFVIYDDLINHKQMIELGTDINDYSNLLIKLTRKNILHKYDLFSELDDKILEPTPNKFIKFINSFKHKNIKFGNI